MKKTLQSLTDNVQWIGWKDFQIAHNKEEVSTFIKKDIHEYITPCEIELINCHGMVIREGCVSFEGSMQIRITDKKGIIYCKNRFLATLIKEEMEFKIANIHCSIAKENRKKIDCENDLEMDQIERMSKDIINKSNYDYLTGLFSLDLFKCMVAKYLVEPSHTGEYAIIYTDILNFEKLNILYGFEKGDEVLLELSNVISNLNCDVIYVSRTLVDHIVLFLRVEQIEDIKKDIWNLSNDFNKRVRERYPEAFLNLVAGIYMIDDENKTKSVDKMVERASIARESVKEGRSLVYAFYKKGLYDKVIRVKEIERTMQLAMINKEFKVYLQPKYDLKTIQIVGAEALTRWIQQDGTMVMPDEFIPIFEKNGFIEQLDFYVLETICYYIKEQLVNNNHCHPISINQSIRLFESNTYVQRVAEILERYKIPPKLIELELTERLFSDQLDEMVDVMTRLKKIGVSWSIDDFGAGYSSLNLLKELPVDIIKIDRGFLNETNTSEVSKIIIRKTVELTQELNKIVICEGVETEKQADYLRTINCDIAQGYLYARPMPISEYQKLLYK